MADVEKYLTELPYNDPQGYSDYELLNFAGCSYLDLEKVKKMNIKTIIFSNINQVIRDIHELRSRVADEMKRKKEKHGD